MIIRCTTGCGLLSVTRTTNDEEHQPDLVLLPPCSAMINGGTIIYCHHWLDSLLNELIITPRHVLSITLHGDHFGNLSEKSQSLSRHQRHQSTMEPSVWGRHSTNNNTHMCDQIRLISSSPLTPLVENMSRNSYTSSRYKLLLNLLSIVNFIIASLLYFATICC